MGRAKTIFREGREEHEGIHEDFGVQHVIYWGKPDFLSVRVFLRASSRPSRIAPAFAG
ncbi:MAG: hypothetical protein Q8L71_03305 [Thiobacillus sp.]|nr:hypothetical protein [Thiobacillus sp.]